MKKRIFAFLLCTLLCIVPACSAQRTEETNVDRETETESVHAEEEVQSLPSGDFQGYECHFAQYIFGHLSNMSKYQVTVDETSGEAVNDALYNASRTVEDRLCVVLKTDVYTERDDVNTTLRSAILAGDNVCDAFFSLDANSYFRDGSILNLSDISTLHFDNPWWNRNAIDSIRLTNDIFLGYGALSTMQYSNYIITLFNKKIAADIGMEDPYAMVREDRWTLDVMKSSIETAVQDVNGDGKMDAKNDIYGHSACEPGMMKMLYGSGASLFGRDADGTITYRGIDENFYAVFEKLSGIFSDKKSFYLGWSTSNVSQYHMMKTNQTLFADPLVLELEELRDMETDYGVIPSPKFDETQAEYISYIYSDCAPLTVPVTVEDPERTGTIIENLCAETYTTVKDIYLEDLLEQKLLRDQESIEMMRIILDSKAVVDPCYIYNWGGVVGVLTKAIQKNPTDVISRMEAIDEALSKEVADSIALAKGE